MGPDNNSGFSESAQNPRKYEKSSVFEQKTQKYDFLNKREPLFKFD